MEKEGFLLRLEEEEEDTLQLWVWVWALSNLPLQFSLLTEALLLSSVLPVLPGLWELILAKIMVEVGMLEWGHHHQLPADQAEAEADEEGEEETGAHDQ